ncbi:MAG TPA: hypothetical protein PKA49_05215 [Tepidiformaceae bacterium]|nr:hypothetical protein [Tepidiformaceae bacterium]
MRLFLVQAAVLGAVALVVMALVFRNQRARDLLRTLRNVAWVAIALVFALGLYRLWQQGL